MDILNFSAPSTGSWIVDIIYWIVSVCGNVAIGVIVFTIVLKLLTFPFDYFSRASMRKNSVKMEEMRPELEKLQRQYADNKEMYNRKMMALYKRNGYSMWGACLPTILTLVIFIVAINAFTDYSKFQNKTYFYNMSNSYNNVVYAGFEYENNEEYIYRTENGTFKLNLDNVLEEVEDQQKTTAYNENIQITETLIFNFTQETDKYRFSLYTKDGYVKLTSTYTINTDGTVKQNFNEDRYILIEKKLLSLTPEQLDNDGGVEDYKLASKENNFLKINGKTYNELKGKDYKVKQDGTTIPWDAERFILDIRQSKSAETYRNEQQSFFWVKNIWATDSPTSRPIESSWSKFKQTHGYNGANIDAVIDVNGDNGYNSLIKKLSYEKNAPNGYFILVALTALSSLFMQLVTAKSQKAQMELQTVDGQGAQTQKIMKWVMPIMMAVFAFMYTAAFSLYIVMSSLISIGTTYLINFIVDRQVKKENLNKKTDQKIRGRIYVKKPVEKKEEPKKEKKNDKDNKFAHQQGGDFLTGKVKVKKNKK